MPFQPHFNFPFFYNNYRYPRPSPTNFRINEEKKKDKTFNKNEKDSEIVEPSESFFEIFGIKLYFDDILIICILFFLYNEKVQDEELFICLILLLLT